MRNLFKLVFVLLMGNQLMGCDVASSAAAPICLHTFYCSNGGEIMSCATDSSAYYTLRGSSYYCTATYDCASAATAALNNCSNPYKATAAKSSEENLLLSTMENAQLRKSIDQMYIDMGKEVQQTNQ